MSEQTVLVVDDDATNRLKMAAAVRHLGYRTHSARDGQEALEALRANPFDAVLLDILMPEMDGFEVLRKLKADHDLRDVPVIVISALDDHTESVVRAIELGAEDFLPKNFDPVVLRARLGASLEKKRFRDQEREYRRLVARLTHAAEVVEAGAFRPERLDIDDVAARDDALGHLARVFKNMAAEIYERELRLRRNVRTLRGGLLVLAVGATWGLVPPLSRMAAGLESSPLHLTMYANLIGAVACLGWAALRGGLSRPSFEMLRFALIWSMISGLLSQPVVFFVTGHVQASTVSLIVTLEGFLVFAVAAALRLERASLRRLGGLLLGLLGAALVILARFDLAAGDGIGWVSVALLIPCLFAAEDIFVASRRPAGLDPVATVGLMMFFSCILISPFALIFEDPIAVGPRLGHLEVTIFAIGVVIAVASVITVHLTSTAGAVFASQGAYTITVAGIVWSMLLLDERLSALAWLALGLMIAGLYFVGPQASAEDQEFRLPFNRSRERL